MSAKNASQPERRRFQRFAVVEGMIEPITVDFNAAAQQGAAHDQPAILTNLSAGGMSLILFLEPPRTKKLEMLLNIPGLSAVPVEGKVVRMHEKGQTFNVGIMFTRISKKHQDQIGAMAQDNGDCEMRIALKLPEACVPGCRFAALCAKPQKLPPKAAS
ncbi:MAG: PilZ domain-containing protein [Elusimicrobia bacterium]|nr:PilZ domain-containing protein [Elusimicrobiota bacterium]MDE2237097.1 PilZ domain-containing protein [Elusimicrobiota bacterium]MDE2425856.1 PilZ domain-containing protein [Elusimicrobiota bacterium]